MDCLRAPTTTMTPQNWFLVAFLRQRILSRTQKCKLFLLFPVISTSVLDPGKQTELVKIPDLGPDETTEAISAAKEAFASWSQVPPRVRTTWQVICQNDWKLPMLPYLPTKKWIVELLGAGSLVDEMERKHSEEQEWNCHNHNAWSGTNSNQFLLLCLFNAALCPAMWPVISGKWTALVSNLVISRVDSELKEDVLFAQNGNWQKKTRQNKTQNTLHVSSLFRERRWQNLKAKSRTEQILYNGMQKTADERTGRWSHHPNDPRESSCFAIQLESQPK